MKTKLWTPLMAALLSTTLFMGTPAQAVVPTTTEIQTLVNQGQAYLLGNYVVDSETSGHWAAASGYELPVTCATVAALLETGKYGDVLYKTKIDNAINYIKTFIKTDTLGGVTYHGIYQNYDYNYDNGLALLALSLYGQQTTFATPELQTAYNAVVNDAMQFLISGQSASGGWRYNYPSTGTDADMSVTQFGAMGMYYGSHYLNVTIDPAVADSWSNKLYAFLQSDQDTTDSTNPALYGRFYYTPSGSTGTPLSMTGAGLWSLAMIGKGGGVEANRAIDWFAANYSTLLGDTWQNNGRNDYYMVYAVSKALTATLGVGNMLGGSTGVVWADGLKTALFTQATTASSLTHWVDNNDLTYVDPNSNMSTAFVLMSLAFADTNLGTIEKLLPDTVSPTYPPLNQGLVTLRTNNGVTISVAGRANAGAEGTQPATVILPLGSFDFTLNLPTTIPATTTAVLTLSPPAGAFDPANPDSFVKADGTLKDGINWFKVVGGTWQGSSLPITVDLVNKVIRVTLTDGGAGDADGMVNGKIVDPGAPGVSTAPAEPVVTPTDTPAVTPVATTSNNGNWFGCSMGHNGTPDPTLPLMAVGALVYLIRRRA